MTSNDVVKTVSKKLKYYFDVKRLEDGFDLSGPNQPILDHPPLKARPTLQYDGLHDRPLKHYFNDKQIRVQLTQFKTPQEKNGKEKKVKKKVTRYMKRYRFVHNTLPDAFYINTKNGPKLRSEATPFGIPMNKNRKPFKGGHLLLRSTPPRSISRGEAHRLVNAATKLLVASETTELNGNSKSNGRPQSSKSKASTVDGQDEKKLPKLPPPASPDNYAWERSKLASKKRQFFVYDQDGRRHLVKVREKEDKDEDRSEYDSAYSPTPHSSAIYLIDGEEAEDDQVPGWLRHEMNRRDPESDSEWVRPRSAYATEQPSKQSSTEPEHKPRPHSAAVIERPRSATRRGEKPRSRSPSDLSLDSEAEPVPLEDEFTQTPKEMLQHYDMLNELIQQGPQSQYRVHVFTGTKLGSSTKADVRLQIHGDKGCTPEVPLKNSKNHKIQFIKGQEDIFEIKNFDVGPVRKITIGHSRLELGYGWFLEKVVIHDITHAMTYMVPCKKWLSSRDDDGKTLREFYVELSAEYIHQEEKSDTEYMADENLKIISYENATESEDTRTLTRTDHSGSHTSLDTNPTETKPESETNETSDDSEEETERRDVTRLGSFRKDTKRDQYPKVVVKQKQEYAPEPPSQPKPAPRKKPAALSQEGEPDGLTRLGSRNTPKPPTSPTSPRRKDDFFDQTPARKDYSFVSDTLSQSTTDQDSRSDFDSEKPMYSARDSEDPKLQRLNEEAEDGDRETSEPVTPAVIVTRPDTETDTSSSSMSDRSSSRHSDRRASPRPDADRDFMDGFKAGLEAGKSDTPRSTTSDTTTSSEEDPILRGPTMHDAAKTGDLERIKELVHHSPQNKSSTNEKGWSPLHTAATEGNVDVIKWLCVNEANMEAETPTGYTAMHMAAMNGHTNCMMVLAAMGAKVGCLSIDNQAPLHLAAMIGHLESCKWLVANRASLEVMDNLGRTPYTLAVEYNRHEVAAFLKTCEEEQYNSASSFSQLRRSSKASADPSSTTGSTSGTTGSSSGTTGSSTTASSTETGSETSRSDSTIRGAEKWDDDKEPRSARRRTEPIAESELESDADVSAVMKKKHDDQLLEKKKNYEDQQHKMSGGQSFLDSIRAEYDQEK